jgi:protein gp37
MENSKIEWCDHTFNPWMGCQHVSPGCDHCYAERERDHRFHQVKWGPHGARKRTTEGTWMGPPRWNREAEKTGKRFRVFCASLADWLDNKVPRSWRDDLAQVIHDTPNLDWLMLTKRIENFDKLAPWHRRDVPRHVWIGVTCENQEWFDRRYKHLDDINAIRFISYEPAIGPLKIGAACPDWVICGGESGKGARRMKPAWARALRDECADLDIAFFMKQIGSNHDGWPTNIRGKGDDIDDWPKDLRVRQFPFGKRA